MSVWRHLAAGGLSDGHNRLSSGVRILKEHRLGDSKWRRFPFFYTLLALYETGGEIALDELQYAAPRLERLLRRKAKSEKYHSRRRVLAERILDLV